MFFGATFLVSQQHTFHVVASHDSTGVVEMLSDLSLA